MPLYNLVSFHSPDERDGTTSTLNRDHLKHLGSFHHRFEKRSHRCSLARPMKSPRSLVSIEEASGVAFHERHSRSSVEEILASCVTQSFRVPIFRSAKIKISSTKQSFKTNLELEKPFRGAAIKSRRKGLLKTGRQRFPKNQTMQIPKDWLPRNRRSGFLRPSLGAATATQTVVDRQLCGARRLKGCMQRIGKDKT